LAKNSYLDPIIIAQLGNLQLRARRILEGLYSGHHINLNRGQSQDFSEHRPYNPGDDLKRIDWKIYGRTDRLVVKQYEEQSNVSATIILDDSASMGYAWGGRPSKLEYAKVLAAAFAYLVVSQHDAVGLLSTRHSLPANSSLGHVDRFFQELDQITPRGTWNPDAIARSLGTAMKKAGFVAIFSDLMAPSEPVINALRSIHARKHEVMIFQILDPAERELPYSGSVMFEDSETGEQLRTEPGAMREFYRRAVSERLTAFSHVFRGMGMDYLLLTSDTPFDRGLGAYLSWRGLNV